MPSFKNLVGLVLGTMDESLDALRARWQRPLEGVSGVRIVPYRGFSNGTSLFLKGRVLRNPVQVRYRDRDSPLRNLLDTYRRFGTREVPGVQVELRWNDSMHLATTDDEGYFTFDLQDLPGPAANALVWDKLELTLKTRTADQATVTTAEVLFPPASAQFGVISDIDDTVLVSNATRRLHMARLAFFHSARRRLPFAGVAAFYRALQAGTGTGVFNPIFYVSSSPWNLYDMLVEFFRWQGIPPGPLLLKDIGVSRTQVGGPTHLAHKTVQIRSVMRQFPHLKFILIGDSGQHDPEVYRQAVQDYPDRILAIYIRDVSQDSRDIAVQTIITALAAHSVPMFLVPDTEVAAQHAAANGWIASEALADIREAKHLPPSDLPQSPSA